MYFQPPESIKLSYPCVIYNEAKLSAKHANNAKYAYSTRYQVTAIDTDPDADWHLGIFKLPMCAHSRSFAHEGLNHTVYDLYY